MRYELHTVDESVSGKEESMPYSSDKQRKFFHTPTAKKKGITTKTVKEFDAASKGLKLPQKAVIIPKKAWKQI